MLCELPVIRSSWRPARRSSASGRSRVRLVQAGLGALTVWLVYRLTREVLVSRRSRAGYPPASWWSVPLIAAAIAALNPYYIAMSELILSEAVFVPLMLLTLWGLAVLWGQDR